MKVLGREIKIRKLAIVSLALILVALTSFLVQSHYSSNVQNSVNVVNSAYAASDQKAYSVDPALVSANTQFAFNLFQELGNETSDSNIFISPLSISMALAMTYNGAEGTTKEAMSNTLCFDNMSLEQINQAFANLSESLQNVDKEVNLMIGNSVWMNQEFAPSVYPSFLERVQTSYNGQTFTRNFENAQTVNEINNWIDNATKGKIQNMITQIDPDTVMFLINAIYFKGSWVTSFDPSQTKQQDFFLSPGNTIQVNMMQTSGNFSYYSDDNCQVARLPYGRDKIAMYIFLPNEGVPLDSFIASLNQTTHDAIINKLETVSNLIVQLPKFTVEYGVKCLNTALENLGMTTAFDPNAADFNGIASPAAQGNLYISFVDHKAVIEVNEQGTEAAAATIVNILPSISPIELPHTFIANRPFYFEIRDDRSGSILFMGKIVNPTN